MALSGSASAIRIAAFPITDANRARQQIVRNRKLLHQRMFPLAQTGSLRTFDVRQIDPQFRPLRHLIVIIL